MDKNYKKKGMRQFNFSNLRFRLLLIVFIASIPAFLYTINHAVEDRSDAEAQIEQEALQLTKLTIASHEQWIEGARQLVIALGNIPAVRDRKPAECNEFMAQLINNYPIYENIFAVTPDGEVFCSAASLNHKVNTSDLVYFQKAVSSHNFSIGDYQSEDRITGVPVVVAAYPVYDDWGSLQAVVCVSIDPEWLNKLAGEMQLPPGSTFRIIDQKGTILARNPNPEKWVGRTMPEESIIHTTLTHHEGTAEDKGVDGVTRFFSFAPIHSGSTETGLFVSNGIPVSVIYTQINQVLVRNLIYLGIVIFFMFGIAWFVSGSFVIRPINALLRATERLGTGDLGARSGLNYEIGEIGEFARIFDGMAGSLQEREVQRTQAEKELKKLQSEHQIMLDTVPAWIFFKDKNNTFIRVNKVFADVMNMTSEQLAGKSMNELYPEEQAEAFWKDDLEIIATGNPKLNIIEPININDKMHWVQTDKIPYKDSKGNIIGIIGFTIDITQRKEAEEKLQEALFYSRSLLESTLDPLVTINPEGKITDTNKATEIVTGLSREKLIGNDFSDYFTDPDKAKTGYQEVFKNGFVRDYSLSIKNVSGKVTDVIYNATIYKNPGGKVLGAFAAARDITQLKLIREERNRLVAREAAAIAEADAAKKLNQLKSDILNTMSHEFRTPMNAIIGFSDLIKLKMCGELTKTQEQFINNISNSAKHLQSIISDLLDIVKLESGEKLPLMIELFNVPEVIEETLAFMSEKVDEKNLIIIKEIDSEINVISADKIRFKKILMNCLDNAIKFSKPEGGIVTIRSWKIDGFAQFSITDTGIGIREEDMTKIFSLFYQVDSGLTRKYGGIGMGLHTVKKLVEQHGGRMWAESKYGEGTTLTFTLPLKI
ncbi:MAG: PAS domain S-box protein [Candidatus Methanoperedens sp.]|nr:PAS domain S-box protein [Candidatus Methanoperedens sp.]